MKQSRFTKRYLVNLELSKPYLLEYFTRVYGEEYRRLILERLDEVYVLFKGDDKQFIDAAEKSVLAKENSGKKTQLTSDEIDLINTKEALDAEAVLDTLLEKYKYELDPYLAQDEVAYNKAVKNRDVIKRKIDAINDFNNNFLDALDKFCFEISGVNLSIKERNNIRKILDDHETEHEQRILAIYVICLANALGVESDKLSNLEEIIEKHPTEANEAFNKEIDLGPLYGGSKTLQDTIIHVFGKIMALEESLEDSYLDSRLFDDTVDFIRRSFYGQTEGVDEFIAYILNEKINLHIPIPKKRNDGFLNVVVYNANTLSDNIIIHELDHAIMQSIVKNYRNKFEMCQGLKVVTIEDGNISEDGTTTAQMIINKLTDKGKLDLLESLYEPVIDKRGRKRQNIEALSKDIHLFNEVCTDYRTEKIVDEMHREGVVLFNEKRSIISEYSAAFAGCDNLFEHALPYITACTIEGKIDLLIDSFGADKFVQLLHHVRNLASIDMKKCAVDMEGVYYRYAAGFYHDLDKRRFTKEEIKYLENTDAINELTDDLVCRLNKSDDLIKNFWAPVNLKNK